MTSEDIVISSQISALLYHHLRFFLQLEVGTNMWSDKVQGIADYLRVQPPEVSTKLFEEKSQKQRGLDFSTWVVYTLFSAGNLR